MEQVIRRLKMGYNPKELQEIYGLSDEEMFKAIMSLDDEEVVKAYADKYSAMGIDIAPKKRGRPKKAVIA